MLAVLSLYLVSISLPQNLLTLLEAAQQPTPSLIELNCKSGEASERARHPFQFCVPDLPPLGQAQAPRKCSQPSLTEGCDEISSLFNKNAVTSSHLCLILFQIGSDRSKKQMQGTWHTLSNSWAKCLYFQRWYWSRRSTMSDFLSTPSNYNYRTRGD